MPSVPTPTKAGIVEDDTGNRHIPATTRADGSKRKEIKIRPGYKPPEDVEVYKNRTAEGFRARGQGPPPGAEGLKDDDAANPTNPASAAAAAKNAKRREARKKAAEGKASEGSWRKSEEQEPVKVEEKKEEVDPEVERLKKARNLKKKLKQAQELRQKKEENGGLLPDQIAKVMKISELIRDLDALGFDADGEPKEKKGEVQENQKDEA